MPVSFDDSTSTLLRIDYQGVVSDEDVQSVVARVQSRAETGAPFVAVVDARNCEALSASQRRILAEGMDNTGGSLRACGMVMDSVVIRGVLTAMLWLSKPKFEIKSFSEPESAEAWARSFL